MGLESRIELVAVDRSLPVYQAHRDAVSRTAAEYDRAGTAAAAAERQSRALADTTSRLTSAMGGLMAAFGGAQILSQIDQWTKFTAQLKLASVTTAEYANSLNDVKRISKDAQSDLSSTGVLYARIANGTRELGVSQKKVAEITETVNLSLKVSGATFSESSSAMLQLSQAFASGTLRGEEFNAVNEAAPRLMKALADGIGVPVGALKSMASEGKITSEIMANALPKALAELREEAKSVQTIGGSFVVLKNAVLEFVGTKAEANGTVSIINSGVSLLANNLGLVAAAATGLAAAKLGEMLATVGVAAVQGARNTLAYAEAQSVQRATALASAQAEVAAATATAEHAAMTQLAIVATRESVVSKLALVNASIASATAQINASKAAGAQSFALASLAQGEAALAVAMQARGAVMAELALLGQQQARVSATITAANAAQTASQTALTAATAAGGAASGLASKALGFLGGPIGAISVLLGVGVAAWMAWGGASKTASETATESFNQAQAGIMKGLDDRIKKSERFLELQNAGVEKKDIDKNLPVFDSLEKLSKRLSDINNRTGEFATASNNEILVQRARAIENIAVQTEKMNKATALEAKADASGKAASDMIEVRQRLMGVNKQYLEDLTALENGRKKGAIGEQEYIRLVSQLATETYNKSKAGKEAAKTTSEEANAYDSIIRRMKERSQSLDEELRTTKASSASDKIYIDLMTRLADGTARATKTELEYARALNATNQAKEVLSAGIKSSLAKYEKETQDRAKQLLDVYNNQVLTYGRMAEAASEYALSIQQGIDYSNLEVSLMGRSVSERETILSQYRIEIDLQKRIQEIKKQNLLLADEEALVLQVTATAAVEKSQAAIKAQRSELTGYLDTIERTAHDTFISIANGSKDLATRLRETLQNGFFEWLWQVTAKKWIVNIGASMSENIAGGAAGAAASAVAGGGGGSGLTALSLLSSAKSVWTGITSGLSSITTSFGEYVQTGINMFKGMGYQQASMSAQIGPSSSASGIGMAGGIAAAVVAAMAVNNSLYKQGWDIKNGTEANGLGMLVNGGLPTNGFLSLFSSVGAVKLSDSIMQKLGMSSQLASLLSGSSVISALFGNKNPEITRRGISGSVTGSNFAGQTEVDWFSKGGWFSSDKSGRQTGAVAAEISSMLGDTYKGITDATGAFAKAIGINADYLATRAQAINFDIGATDADTQANITKMFETITNDVSKELIDMANKAGYGLDTLAKKGETTTETLSRVAAEITGVNEILQTMGYKVYELNGAGVKAADAMVQLYGGLDKMAAVSANYYDNYYSDAEKASIATSNITAEFKKIGADLPTSLGQLREWIEAAKALGTEAGDKTYVSLMQLTGAFASLNSATASLKDTATKTANSLADSKSDFILRTMEAQGLGKQAQNLQRQKDYIQLDDELKPYAANLNRALDEKEARELVTRQSGLMVQVLELEGNTVQAAALKHKLDIDATEEGLRPLAERIYQLKQEASAAEVAQRHRALDIELMRALGNEEGALAAERADALKGLDEYSKAIKQQTWAANDAKAAIEKAKASAQAEAQRIQQEIEKQRQDYESAKSAAESKLSAAVSRRTSELNSLATAMDNFGKQARDARESMIYGASSTLGPEAKYLRARDTLGSLETRAMSQDAGAISELQQFIELSRAYNASNGVFVSEFDRVQAILDKASKTAMSQADYARAQLGALNDSVRGLIDIKDATTDSAQDVVNAIKELTDVTRGYMAPKNTASGVSTTTAPTPDQIYGGLPGEGAIQARRVLALKEEAVKVEAVTAYMERMLQEDLRAAQSGGVTNQYYMDLNDKYYTQAAFEKFARELGMYASSDPFVASKLPKFARGGVFTNGIVDQPTNFSMGQMGEAGPEGIMPLAQGPNGLGVHVYGGGSSGNNKESIELAKRQVIEAERNNDLLEEQNILAAKQNDLLELILTEGASSVDIRELKQYLGTTLSQKARAPA